MANDLRLPGDLIVPGRIVCESISLPSNSVNNAAIEAEAGIGASKVQQRVYKRTAQESDTTSVSYREVIHTVHGAAGTALSLKCGSVTVCTGNATITVDLLVNGVSILDAAYVLNNSKAARTPYEVTISDAALEEDDVVEVDVVVAAGTGALGKGVFAEFVANEDASP